MARVTTVPRAPPTRPQHPRATGALARGILCCGRSFCRLRSSTKNWALPWPSSAPSWMRSCPMSRAASRGACTTSCAPQVCMNSKQGSAGAALLKGFRYRFPALKAMQAYLLTSECGNTGAFLVTLVRDRPKLFVALPLIPVAPTTMEDLRTGAGMPWRLRLQTAQRAGLPGQTLNLLMDVQYMSSWASQCAEEGALDVDASLLSFAVMALGEMEVTQQGGRRTVSSAALADLAKLQETKDVGAGACRAAINELASRLGGDDDAPEGHRRPRRQPHPGHRPANAKAAAGKPEPRKPEPEPEQPSDDEAGDEYMSEHDARIVVAPALRDLQVEAEQGERMAMEARHADPEGFVKDGGDNADDDLADLAATAEAAMAGSGASASGLEPAARRASSGQPSASASVDVEGPAAEEPSAAAGPVAPPAAPALPEPGAPGINWPEYDSYIFPATNPRYKEIKDPATGKTIGQFQPSLSPLRPYRGWILCFNHREHEPTVRCSRGRQWRMNGTEEPSMVDRVLTKWIIDGRGLAASDHQALPRE